MSKRPPVSLKMKVDAVLRQAFGNAICPLCHTQLLPEHPRIFEHMVPFAWVMGHVTENMAWVHKDCAAKKTNGNKATCADGDIHKIAKAKRIQRMHEEHVARVLGKHAEPGEMTVAVRKSRPIPSRPFPKRVKP
jgi:hypothetical protein